MEDAVEHVEHGHRDRGDLRAAPEAGLGVVAHTEQVHLHARHQVERVARPQHERQQAVEHEHGPAGGEREERDASDEVVQQVGDVEDALADPHAAGYGVARGLGRRGLGRRLGHGGCCRLSSLGSSVDLRGSLGHGRPLSPCGAAFCRPRTQCERRSYWVRGARESTTAGNRHEVVLLPYSLFQHMSQNLYSNSLQSSTILSSRATLSGV